VSDRDSLALVRTTLAHERTLMAWVRTSTSLISFGFTIYKFFDAMRQANVTRTTHGLLGPREVALVMIGLGVAALLLATWEHQRALKMLRESYGEYGGVPRSLAGALAATVALLGTAGLVLVFLRQ
jgi:putative membrane protein